MLPWGYATMDVELLGNLIPSSQLYVWHVYSNSKHTQITTHKVYGLFS